MDPYVCGIFHGYNSFYESLLVGSGSAMKVQQVASGLKLGEAHHYQDTSPARVVMIHGGAGNDHFAWT